MSAATIKRGRQESIPLPGLPRSEEDIAADPQPGDIYQTSWGYDQTNTEFFEVVKRTPGTVTVRRIGERMGDLAHGENPRLVYPAPGHFVDDFDVPVATGKVCRLTTRLLKWQSEGDEPYMGGHLTIDNVRTAWPYSTGGSYDTLAAGEPGH